MLPGGIAGEGLGRMTGMELVEVPPGLNEEGADEGGGDGPGGEELNGLPGPRTPAARSARYPSPELGALEPQFNLEPQIARKRLLFDLGFVWRIVPRKPGYFTDGLAEIYCWFTP